jgi:hypothetical protein
MNYPMAMQRSDFDWGEEFSNLRGSIVGFSMLHTHTLVFSFVEFGCWFAAETICHQNYSMSIHLFLDQSNSTIICNSSTMSDIHSTLAVLSHVAIQHTQHT